MGSFSWLRADRSTKRKNIAKGDSYKILIPKEFGGGYIKDVYHDYGYPGVRTHISPVQPTCRDRDRDLQREYR